MVASSVIFLVSLLAFITANPLAIPQIWPSDENANINETQHQWSGYPKPDEALFRIQLNGYALNYKYAKYWPEDLKHGRCVFHDTRSFLLENVIQPAEHTKFDAQHTDDSRFRVTISSNVPEGCLLAVRNRVPSFNVQEYQLFQGCGVGGVEMRGIMQESIILREGFYVQFACDQNEIEQMLPSDGQSTISASNGASTEHHARSTSTTEEEESSNSDGTIHENVVNRTTTDGFGLETNLNVTATKDKTTWKLKSNKCGDQKLQAKSRHCPKQPYNGPVVAEFCSINARYEYEWQEFFGEWQSSTLPSRELPGYKVKVSSLQSCASTSGCVISTSMSGSVTDGTSSTSTKTTGYDVGIGAGMKTLLNLVHFGISWSRAWSSSSEHGVTLGAGWSNADMLMAGQQGFLECQSSVKLHRYLRCNKGIVEEELRLQHLLNGEGLAICFINLVLVP